MSHNDSRRMPTSAVLPKKEEPPSFSPSISVSFRYLSKNKKRNFNFFGDKDWRSKANALEQLLAFLQRLTAKTRVDIACPAKDQDCGFENLDFKRVKCPPNGRKIMADDKITVFRFGNNANGGDYRLLGFFEDRSSVLCVIGFDFDYTAYPHN